MLALGIRYLTGYAVATDVSSREQAEWPPHPARIFMAMAAAMFETGEDMEERKALEWLERQGNPAINVSDAEPRRVVTHYVPINDSGDPVKGNKTLTALQSVAIGRDRQPRTFPRVRPSEDTVFLVWPESNPRPEQCTALEKVCTKVTRIGHSSSLVQMWVEEQPPVCNMKPAHTGELRLRIATAGTLDYLASVFNRDDIEAYVELSDRFNLAKGAEKKQLKQEILKRFEEREPTRLRPTISQWKAYQQEAQVSGTIVPASGAFEREVIVLTIEEGPVVGLESTWRLLTILQKTILTTCDPTPEWLSGHAADGTPSQQPHVALFPLAFVGQEYADGHLMGIALALPKGIAPRERGRALRGLLYDEMGLPKHVDLKAGSLGSWRLVRETRPSPALALQSHSWTTPSYTWASVTPIVLDQHPKVDRGKDRELWSLEVANIIAESCQRQGLPQPVSIDVDKTSWHRGAPRAVGGKSSGYPLMPVKEGQSSRQQVHAWLRFDQPVEGPLLLGAGRYRGYGVCRPWKGGK